MKKFFQIIICIICATTVFAQETPEQKKIREDLERHAVIAIPDYMPSIVIRDAWRDSITKPGDSCKMVIYGKDGQISIMNYRLLVGDVIWKFQGKPVFSEVTRAYLIAGLTPEELALKAEKEAEASRQREAEAKNLRILQEKQLAKAQKAQAKAERKANRKPLNPVLVGAGLAILDRIANNANQNGFAFTTQQSGGNPIW